MKRGARKHGDNAATKLVTTAIDRLLQDVLGKDSYLAVTARVVRFAKDPDQRGDAYEVVHEAVTDVASDDEWQRYCRAIGWAGTDRAAVSSDGVLSQAWEQIGAHRDTL